jgi:hypothetical protein
MIDVNRYPHKTDSVHHGCFFFQHGEGTCQQPLQQGSRTAQSAAASIISRFIVIVTSAYKSSIYRRHDGPSIATPQRISEEMPKKGC